MKTYLVTGVSGFLGVKLARALLDAGHKVIGIGRKPQSYLPDSLVNHDSFIYNQASLSIDELTTLNGIVIDGVFHLASCINAEPKDNLEQFYEDNVRATHALLMYCRQLVLDFFVFTSTNSVFGKPVISPIDEQTCPAPANYYGLTKYMAEQLVGIEAAQSKTKYIVFRFSSIFGKGDTYGLLNTLSHMFRQNEKVELYSNGKIHRSVILADDVVNVLTLVIEKFENLSQIELFEIGGAESIRTVEIARIIKEHIGSQSEIILSDKQSKFDWDVFIDSSYAKSKLGFQPGSVKASIMKYLDQQKNEL